MRFRFARALDRKTLARTSLLGTAALLLLAAGILLTLESGGARSASTASAQSQTSTTFAAHSTNVDAGAVALEPLAAERIQHEKIMADQGRGSSQAIPTTTGSGSRPVASSTTIPSAQKNVSTRVVLGGGRTPLRGTWSGNAQELASFLLKINPSPRFSVSTSVLAGYYVRFCAETGLRADLLWAQMIRETGYGKYGGDVSPNQNNYAGIGATGGGAGGAAFASAEAGVKAHVAHMVAYVYTSSPAAWACGTVDPRFDMVAPRGAVTVLSDLDGRWAVPGTGYGEAIEATARAINSN